MPGNKKPKDKNAPKRSLSAYMLFSQDERPKILAKNKNLKITEVAKEIGSSWAKLSDSDKKKYQDKAAKNKAAYDKELAKYKQSSQYKKYENELKEWKQTQKDGKKSPKKTPKKTKSKSKKSSKKSKK
jgi:structure-specific recognition protein 1